MDQELERRLRRVEDRFAIQDLAVRYCHLVDEADVDGVTSLFTVDATFRTASGQSKGSGSDGIETHFAGRFEVLGPTNHFVHGHVVDFDDTDDDLATGTVYSHAEVSHDGTGRLAALRYHDVYRRTADGWKFADRLQAFMYYTDVAEYEKALAHPADWPSRFTS